MNKENILFLHLDDRYNYIESNKYIRIMSKDLANYINTNINYINTNIINVRFIDNCQDQNKSRLYKRMMKLADYLGYSIKPINDFSGLGSIREYYLYDSNSIKESEIN